MQIWMYNIPLSFYTMNNLALFNRNWTKEYFEFYAKSVKHSVLHICNICISFNRKKLKSTSKYIYQTLFLNGENSDIKICALGEEWNLHKIYLCQVSILFFYLSKQGSHLKLAQTPSSPVLSYCISQ